MQDLSQVEDKSQEGVSFPDFRKLTGMIKIYAVHPDAILALGPTDGDMENIQNAAARDQKEIFVVTMPANIDDCEFATRKLHIIRAKDRPKDEKPHGLEKKGYMLVCEPDAMQTLEKMCKDALVQTELKSKLGVFSRK